jgi:Family of unknown function (DUF6311)
MIASARGGRGDLLREDELWGRLSARQGYSIPLPPQHAHCRVKGSGLLALIASRFSMLIGGLLGLAWFNVVFGPSVLNPTYLSWVMQGDGAAHVLGWLFFRHEPWSWPLGSVPSFPYPVGTTVGYTDSIPWLAILAKAVSPVLPADFQYIGPWLALCFFLQGWFGVRIVQELSADPLAQVLGGACFIVDPVLIWRVGHSSLCAHWLILGLIWLHLRPWPVGQTPRYALALALGFCIIGASIHPYLAVMVLALGLALLCKFYWIDHTLSALQMVLWGMILGAVTLGIFTALGYIGSGISWGANGFGEYSADLLTLINPAASRFLPAFPVAPGQYEGFGYVGTGVLILSVIATVIIWYNPHVLRGRSLKPWVPLGICVALLAVFALSSRVTVAGKTILTLGHFYRPFMEIIAPFRTSGRFIWPLHYVWITAVVAIWVSYHRSSRLFLYTVFIAIISIQIVDVKGPFLRWYVEYHLKKQPFALQINDWKYATGLYKHMVLYPPLILGGVLPGCVMPGFEADYYAPLAYQAYRLNVTFNSGSVSRIDERKGREYCRELHDNVKEGKFESDTIYVIHNQYWDLVRPHIPKLVCGQLSDYITCVASLRSNVFRDFLEQHKFE